jgi:hypothetical protein
MARPLRHLQIHLDEEHYALLEKTAGRRGAPMEVVVLEAIDRLLQDDAGSRRAAGARFLAAAPMPVDDWETLKGELSDAAIGRTWRERD